MGAQGAGDEAETADEQDQHDERIEEAGGAKVDAHIGEDAGKDEEGSGEGKNPAGDAAGVPEKKANAEEQRQESDAEGVGAEKAPEGADHADLIGEEVSAEAGHDDAEKEMAEAAGSATDVAQGAVFHGLRIAERARRNCSANQRLVRNEQSGSAQVEIRRTLSVRLKMTIGLWFWAQNQLGPLNIQGVQFGGADIAGEQR